MKTASAILLLLAATALTFAAPPRTGPESAAPDLLFFARKIAPDLHARCAGCHSDPELAGRYRLEPLTDPANPDPATVLRNFRATLAHVDAQRPGESRLLTKPLGGEGHPAGSLFSSARAPDYLTLVDFVLGATLENRPPVAIMMRRYEAKVGSELELDGTLSEDPDGNEITYRWKLLERPPGSRAEPADRGDGTVRLSADRAGAYRMELRVHDGELWSQPASFLVLAAGRPASGAAKRPERDGAARPEKAFLDRRLDPHRLRLVRRLYFDLKWRSPRSDEIERWYAKSHDEMVDAFLADEETWSAWYEQQLFYFLLLDRFRPKEGRLTTIPARLTSGRIGVARAVEEIVRSQYFNARNPGNDTFVTVVLEQCLGVVVQERKGKRLLDIGKKMYDGYRVRLFKAKGDSQADFVKICFSQPQFYRHFLARTWKELHGAEIGEKRLEPFVQRCVADRGEIRAILAEWLKGDDYVGGAKEARTKPEVPYVRSLFVDTLGRTPTYDELRNVRNAFLSLADPTPIRLVMGRVLLESSEARMPASALAPKRFVQEQFVRLFARQPSAKELAAFSSALESDPAVTPKVVLWTLISSPEYQTY